MTKEDIAEIPVLSPPTMCCACHSVNFVFNFTLTKMKPTLHSYMLCASVIIDMSHKLAFQDQTWL